MKVFKVGDIDIVRITVNPFYRKIFNYLYFIDGVLVDTGPRKRKLIPVLQAWDIEQVVITHHHEDHTGMAPYIAENLQAELFYHEKTREFIKDDAYGIWYGKLFKTRQYFEGTVFPSVIRTNNYEFHPIDTPGHTTDHVCLYEPSKGWLFTGDLYITPYPKAFLKEESINDYIMSLEKLCLLHVDTIFCGHEGIVTNGKDMIKRKLHYLQQTRHTVTKLHERGWKDNEIVKEVFPEIVRLEIVTLGNFSRKNLVRSCYANS